MQAPRCCWLQCGPSASQTLQLSQGVMISHAAVVAEVASIQAFFQQIGDFSITPDDAMLSYLPLAHIFDRCVPDWSAFLLLNSARHCCAGLQLAC